MCRHQYPEQFVDRVGCVINALSESRSQSCCPTDSRGEQAPWSLPASSRASKAFGFRLADSSLNLANTTVKWKKPLPKTAASPQHTCLFMHNSQVQSLQRSVLDCLMIPLSSLGQSTSACVSHRAATNSNTAHSPSVVQHNSPIYCKRGSANVQTLTNRYTTNVTRAKVVSRESILTSAKNANTVMGNSTNM